MKLSILPKQPLSPNQEAMVLAVSGSAHHLSDISKRAGYTPNTIRNWLRGSHEPLQSSFDNVIQSIKELEAVPTKQRISWQPKLKALKACLDSGLSVEETANQMGASYYSTVCAIHRYLRAA